MSARYRLEPVRTELIMSESERLSQLRRILGDLQSLIRSTTFLYLGSTVYDAVNAYATAMIADLQLISDSGGDVP